LRFAVVFWILVFARITQGIGAHVHRACESLHPEAIPNTQSFKLKEYNGRSATTMLAEYELS
jgi:hypothetical protein